MAEHVYSNHEIKCRGKFTCDCGKVHNLCFDPTPGSESQRVEGHQCDACRKITTLTVYGDGRISVMTAD